jgi:lycopene beta-cyclase
MLFEAAPPERRVVVLGRFYRLPEGLIERFYAGRTTLADRLRLLAGRPPVPLGRALRCLREPALRGSETSAAVLETRG